MSTPSGHYPLEHRAGEIERLDRQAEAMAADCAVMLERIGVAPGWRCLDLGCGPGGITALLSAWVGPTGHVIGLDADASFLDHARQSAPVNVEFLRGDAYHPDLPSGSFDLVHMRFVAGTAGAPEALLREAMRLARPGGTVALQEPDMAALNCYPPHPAWERLKAAMQGAFTSVGADICLAQRLFPLARAAGLRDVQYRPFLVGVRAGDSWADYLPATVQSLRGTILGRGLMAEGARRGAHRMPRAFAQSRHGLHQLHRRPGVGTHRGVTNRPRRRLHPKPWRWYATTAPAGPLIQRKAQAALRRHSAPRGPNPRHCDTGGRRDFAGRAGSAYFWSYNQSRGAI